MREDFYSIEKIPVLDISFDIENYRYYGELNSQQDCINAMVNDITASKIDILAQDIAERGLLPEHIIVSRDKDGGWIVREGNRRILALKLLNNPDLINNKFLKKKFLNIIGNAQTPIIKTVTCITSDDEDKILNYINNLHASINHGAGRLAWNSGQKTFFDQANGNSGDNARALVLLEILKKYGYEYSLRGKYITTIQRLINSREPMSLLGLSFDRNHFLSIAIDEGTFLVIIKTIFDDFSEGRKHVSDVYNKNDRITYVTNMLADLGLILDIGEFKEYKPGNKNDSDGLEPKFPTNNPKKDDDGNIIEPPENSPASPSGGGSPRNPSPPKPASYERDRVVRIGIRIDSKKYPKIYNVFNELKLLKVKETPIAAAISLRVFIELSIEKYVRENELVSINDREGKLKENMNRVLLHLKEKKQISEDQYTDFEKQRHGSEFLTMTTLQRFVHSLHYQPSYRDINTFWDNIQPLILLIWK